MNPHISRRQFVQTSLLAPLAVSTLEWSAFGAVAPLKLAGFADEISPKLEEQIKVCKELGIRYFELRAVAGKNVMDFDTAMRNEVLAKLKDNGMGVASIGSPIGKAKITDPWPAYFDKFKRAVEVAEFFSAPLIRVFSYFPPGKDKDFAPHRDEIMRRMQAKADYCKDHPVTLVHENEKEIYGEKGPACLDLLKTVNSPKLRCAFDFANFLQVGDDTLVNWKMLKPYVVHIHVKDYNKATKKVVPAGQGDGNIQEILTEAVQSGYNGFLTLEPHLKVAGSSSGETGPELFKVATEALRDICRKAKIELQ
ncbi:MAG: sugar phosphate isomerase/epimerase family protein [Verrucomicrobiota bacterium]